MRYVICNFCGEDDSEPLNRGPDLLLNRDGDFQLVRCRNCGLIYQNPQLTLDELAEHYPENYDPYQESVTSLGFTQRISAQHGLSRRLKLLTRYAQPPGRLLDVGCATGLFLNAAHQQGWQVEGVELSTHAAEYARRQFGLSVFQGTLEQASFSAGTFDVVTMWDVLEHVIDPRETVREVARVLRPGGLLALSLPNPRAIQARVFGSSWVGWDRPRHLHIFTPDVLTAYLREAGFKDPAFVSQGGRLGLSLISLRMFLNQRHVPVDRSQRVERLLYNIPLRIATWPIYRLLEALNRTTVVNVFANLREIRK